MKISFVFFLLLGLLGFLDDFLFFYLFILSHELSHIFIARLFHEELFKINFLLIGLNAKIKNFIFIKPYKKILILLAGPILNLLLAIIFSILNLNKLYFCNLVLFIFNLLPIYPLDGGQIFLAILENISFMTARKTIIILSLILSMIILVIGIIQIILFPFNFSLILVGLYLFKYNFTYWKENNVISDFYYILFRKPATHKIKFIYIKNEKTICDILKYIVLNKRLILILQHNDEIRFIPEDKIVESILNLELHKNLNDIDFTACQTLSKNKNKNLILLP